jgi:hypothetical protein
LVLPIVSKQNIPKLYVLMDGTGVPAVVAETQGRVGKMEGQRAHTRECKLGCVFTQTTVDDEGRPIRDPGSTTYTGAIETAEDFGPRIYTEAWRRGWEWATLRIVIGDGPLRRPAKKVRRGEDCVPKDDLFWTVKQSNSQKLPPSCCGAKNE